MKHYVDNTMTCADCVSIAPTPLKSADTNTTTGSRDKN
jgi:hypothetical protein